jgi:hypothetical protein
MFLLILFVIISALGRFTGSYEKGIIWKDVLCDHQKIPVLVVVEDHKILRHFVN